MGFSCNSSWHAGWQEEIRGHVQVQVKLNPDMSVILQAPMGETGGGSNACSAFACAEALGYLGIGLEDIHWIDQADTETGLKDMVQTDSSCSYLQAELMPRVAKELKSAILDLAAPLLEVPPDDLDIAEGRVFLKSDETQGKTVRDILWHGDMVPLVVTVSQMPALEKTGTPFGATFAEVEVDTETGKVDVLRLVVVHDCGTVMFASGAESQQVGGQCIGMGESLTEEIVFDDRTGAPLNFNWVDYHMPTMMDFPHIEPILLEEWRGVGEYGACGMGEGAATSTPRAIANAVYNAIAVRIDEIPLTPDKVLAALGGRSFPARDPSGGYSAVGVAAAANAACPPQNGEAAL